MAEPAPKEDLAFLQGPIPGMSLTGEPRNVPWENPPQLVTVEEAFKYYTERLLDEDVSENILIALEEKLDIETLAEIIATSSVMNGIHTLDVAILVNPIIRELLMYIADAAEVDYVESYRKMEKEARVPRSVARAAVKEAMQNIEMLSEVTAPTMSEDSMSSRGLMSPRGGV